MTYDLATRRRVAKHLRSTNPDLVIHRFAWRSVSGDTEVRAVVDTRSGPLGGLCRQEITFGLAGDILDRIEAR